MMDIGVVFFGHKGTILDIEQIAGDLGNHLGLPLQSRCFSEFFGHIGFFPSEVREVSAEMPAVGGLGVDWAVEP